MLYRVRKIIILLAQTFNLFVHLLCAHTVGKDGTPLLQNRRLVLHLPEGEDFLPFLLEIPQFCLCKVDGHRTIALDGQCNTGQVPRPGLVAWKFGPSAQGQQLNESFRVFFLNHFFILKSICSSLVPTSAPQRAYPPPGSFPAVLLCPCAIFG